MKRNLITTLLLVIALMLSGIAIGQDMSEGELVYPFQYADLDAYTAATGNTIDMWAKRRC